MLTEDTLRRLESKQEELAVLFLDQSDVEKWKNLRTAKRRGDVYWLKKNANQTLGMITRIQVLMNMHMRGGPVSPTEPPPADGDPVAAAEDQLIAQAEKEAAAMIERVRGGK